MSCSSCENQLCRFPFPLRKTQIIQPQMIYFSPKRTQCSSAKLPGQANTFPIAKQKNVHSCFQDPVGEIIYSVLLDVLFLLSFIF